MCKWAEGEAMLMTPQQDLFCREYALCRNATQAALAAGYAERSARQQAARLMTKVYMKSRIGELLSASAEKAGIALNEVMLELKSICFANMGDFADWTAKSVSLKGKKDLDPSLLAAIESVSETTGKDGNPQLRIKLHSKLRAAELLIKLHEISEIESRLMGIEKSLGIES
jgi:phage terminase small subunit